MRATRVAAPSAASPARCPADTTRSSNQAAGPAAVPPAPRHPDRPAAGMSHSATSIACRSASASGFGRIGVDARHGLPVPQQGGDAVCHHRVVLDHQHGHAGAQRMRRNRPASCRRYLPAATRSTGAAIHLEAEHTEPRPGAERSVTTKPSRSASRRTIARPRPWPRCRLRSTLPICSKSPNTRCCMSGAMPMPLSRTSTRQKALERARRTASSTRPLRRELERVIGQVAEHAAQRHDVCPGQCAGGGSAPAPRLEWRARSSSSGASATGPGFNGSRGGLDATDFQQLVGQRLQRLLRLRQRGHRLPYGGLGRSPSSCWRSTSACRPIAITGWRRVVVRSRKEAQALGLGPFRFAQPGLRLFAQHAFVVAPGDVFLQMSASGRPRVSTPSPAGRCPARTQ